METVEHCQSTVRLIIDRLSVKNETNDKAAQYEAYFPYTVLRDPAVSTCMDLAERLADPDTLPF